jgi:hypothetical protein
VNFTLDGQGALYEQLARALKAAILDGRFFADARLPATRKPPHPGLLVGFAALSCNQIRSAVQLLGACFERFR